MIFFKKQEGNFENKKEREGLKNIFCVLAAFFFLIIFSGAAQAQVGSFSRGTLGGNFSNGGNGDSGKQVILYIASAEIFKRIKDPLMAKHSCLLIAPGEKDKGLSLRYFFQKSLPIRLIADYHEVLLVERVLCSKDEAKAVLWFVYIEKSSLLPEKIAKVKK